MLAAAKAFRHWRSVGVVLACLALFVAGYRAAAWRYGERIAQTERARAHAFAELSREAREADALRQSLSDAIATADALRAQEREVVERVITEEVMRYVETDNARECGFSSDGVRVHDAAATGRMPENSPAPGGASGGAVAATNAQVVQVVTENYGRCLAWRDQLRSLQAWAKQIAKF